MATFFHDAVYDPTSSTNEADSAVLFENFVKAQGTTASPSCLLVSAYISATTAHNVSGSTDPSLKLFIDADMAVLGKSPAAYDNYAGLIRLEYRHHERDKYCEGRSKVLGSFLEVERIFASDAVFEQCEGRARANVEREIEQLKRYVIPGERVEERGAGLKNVDENEKETPTSKTAETVDRAVDISPRNNPLASSSTS